MTSLWECVCVSWCLSASLFVRPVSVSLCACVSVPVCVRVCVFLFGCVCVCACVCECVYVSSSLSSVCVCACGVCLCTVCVCGTSVQMKNFLRFYVIQPSDWYAGGMAAVSLAMPTKLWDSGGRECGRTTLYLHLFPYGEGLSQEPQPQQFHIYTVAAIWAYFRCFFIHGPCGILREPWHGYLFDVLDSGFVYVQRFWKTIYLFAIFIEEIYTLGPCC